jgi:polyhydroxybutyrate depolymerase
VKKPRGGERPLADGYPESRVSTPAPPRRRAPRAAIVALLAILVVGVVVIAAADGSSPTIDSHVAASGQRPPPIIYRPPGLSRATPVPLVLAMHGSGGSAQGMEGQTKLEELARQKGFVLVIPDSATDPPWQDPGDISYIAGLLAGVDKAQNIDRKRQYVTGFSAGGREAYAVACRLSAQFAAVAVVSSALRGSCLTSHPVSELLIYGSQEEALVSGNPATGFPSAAQITAHWRQIDRCQSASPSTVTTVGPVTQNAWKGCAGGSAVSLYIVQGGTHFWPGQSGGTGPDAPGQYSASNAVWAFFAAHPAH